MTRTANGKFFVVPTVIYFLFLSIAISPAKAQSRRKQNSSDPILGDRIAKGIVFQDKLWLRGTDVSLSDRSGGLISLNLVDGSRTVQFQGGVIDMERASSDFWVLRRPSPHADQYVVSVWRKGAFEDLTPFSSPKKDVPLILLDSAGSPLVLSGKSLRILNEQDHVWRMIKLQGSFRWGVLTSAALPKNGDSVYVGFDRGEWGGGLQRVNVRTGIITNVERRDTNELCSGPLNSDCDPVTSVIADPYSGNCVIAAIGLVHFTSTGRILRVCDDEVTQVFERSIMGGWDGKQKMTEAFYGLEAAEDGGIWALSERALYHVASDGTQEAGYMLPKKLSRVSGIYLSREIPGILIVLTDINRAVSVSGYTPLLVPLEEPGTQTIPPQ